VNQGVAVRIQVRDARYAGIAPLEGMASGLPVVAPQAGGVLSYANARNSWLVEPSGRHFAGGVREVFFDDSIKAGKVGQALRTAANFDWPRVAAIFFDLYDELYARSQQMRAAEAARQVSSALHSSTPN
jgi:glycosyltransferase involved in cell wall biosynthesis